MTEVHTDWIKKQMQKAIAAEQSLLRAEKDHREKIEPKQVGAVYDRIISDDEKHISEFKKVGEKYGLQTSEAAEAGGGVVAAAKSMVEDVTTSDPFQSIGHDLMMKSNALNYDLAWLRIFREIGDTDSAIALEKAAAEDEEHQRMMRESLTSVGISEARGHEFEER